MALGLRALAPWARHLQITSAALELLACPFTLASATILLYLSRAEVRALFGGYPGRGAGDGTAEATFALSEVKLGIIPATIGPYVLEAIGARQARRYFLSAERFGAAEAMRIGLVHEVVPQDELDARIDGLLRALLAAGPRAQGEAKALIRAVAHRPIADDVIEGTALRIAAVRSSAEGKEGVAAFLEKRSRLGCRGAAQAMSAIPARCVRHWQPSRWRQPGWGAVSATRAVHRRGLGYLLGRVAGRLAASRIRGCSRLRLHARVELRRQTLSIWDGSHVHSHPGGYSSRRRVRRRARRGGARGGDRGGSPAAGATSRAGSRAAISSPEPFSNWAASFGEDLGVVTVLWLAFAHPIAALVVIAVLVGLSVWLLVRLWRFVAAMLGSLSGAAGAARDEGGMAKKSADV
jgi:hypothetical protein